MRSSETATEDASSSNASCVSTPLSVGNAMQVDPDNIPPTIAEKKRIGSTARPPDRSRSLPPKQNG